MFGAVGLAFVCAGLLQVKNAQRPPPPPPWGLPRRTRPRGHPRARAASPLSRGGS